MKAVKSSGGKQFTAPFRYWVQARTGDVFEVKGKYADAGAARLSAEFLHSGGRYAEVIVQNIDNGRRVASYQ